METLLFASVGKGVPLVFLQHQQMVKIYALEMVSDIATDDQNLCAGNHGSYPIRCEYVSKTQIAPSTFCQNDRFFSS